MVKERDSEIIAWFSWTGRIKSESGPDVPGRETTIVFIARIGLPAWMKGFLTESLDKKGSIVRVVAVAEEIRNVEARLVGMASCPKGAVAISLIS